MNQTQDALISHVRNLLREKGYSAEEVQSIELETDLVGSGYLDSFNIVEIVAFIEDTYSIKITTEHFLGNNFNSVANTAKLVEELKTAKGS